MDSARHDLEFREGQPLLGGVRPAFSPHAAVSTHTFRGQVWYVAQDPVSHQYFRFGPTERRVVTLLDGEHSLREIHAELQRQMGAEAPSFQELLAFVQMLRAANLLDLPQAERVDALYDRVRKKQRERAKQLAANFLFIQIPLYDPDRFLARTLPAVRWMFSRGFLAVWAVVVLAGLGAFVYHIGDLAGPAEGILAPENLFLLWLTFVAVKLVHEFAHAYLAKHVGSEVHRMGIIFLVFTPCLFVDVTGLWGVESKHRRVLVGAAGMMAELFVATIALFVWLATEPGLIHAIAYNAVFIASVSSVLFNGNPLLRFDAYYILSDWAELPNLWTNSRRYLLYLGKRYLLGIEGDPPTAERRERVWFLLYAVASMAYRTMVVVGIILFISSAFFGLGVALGAAAFVAWVVVPFGKLAHYLLLAKATRRHRLRCLAACAVAAGAIAVVLTQLTFPQYVTAPCARVERERAMVRARWGGFVEAVHARDGDWVRAGQRIATCTEPELGFAVVRTDKALAVARLRLGVLERDGKVAEAQAEGVRIAALEERLASLRQRVASLVLTAPCDGRLVAPDLDAAPGRFLRPGESVAVVAGGPLDRVVAVVEQAHVAAVRDVEGSPVAVRFRSDPARVVRCRVAQVLDQATYELPSPGLTHAGGGPVALDAGAPHGDRTLLPWFRVELVLPPDAEPVPLGVTGRARFRIGTRPLLAQWYYRLLRLLRTRFFL